MASDERIPAPPPRMPLFARMRANYREHRTSILLLIFFTLLFILYLIPQVFVFIDAGQAGVLYRRFRGGVQTDTVYGEGTHIISPWNYMTIYDLRVNQVQSQFDVLTSNGLSVAVDISVRYLPKPEYLGYLHQQIGPNYVERIVIPETQSAVRKVFGVYTPEQIYQTQYSLPFTIRNEAAGRLNNRFIVLDDLLIKSIQLPATVQGAIQSKLVAEQAAQEMNFRISRELKEKERLVIEGEGIKQFNQIVGESLNDKLIQLKSIAAFLELAKSGNSNVIVYGQPNSLPMVLGLPNRTAPAGGSPLLPAANTGAATDPAAVVPAGSPLTGTAPVPAAKPTATPTPGKR